MSPTHTALHTLEKDGMGGRPWYLEAWKEKGSWWYLEACSLDSCH
jgi:hypothetical protein